MMTITASLAVRTRAKTIRIVIADCSSYVLRRCAYRYGCESRYSYEHQNSVSILGIESLVVLAFKLVV